MALVYAFLTAGSEEVECLACVDVLRRAGIVVTDGNVTTARGLGYALDLGIEIVKLLIDEDKAMQIKASIQYEDR